jgi:hypothetical protein
VLAAYRLLQDHPDRPAATIHFPPAVLAAYRLLQDARRSRPQADARVEQDPADRRRPGLRRRRLELTSTPASCA